MGDLATAFPADDTSVSHFSTLLSGELVRPSDPSYDRHRRVWNGSIDRRPALIARCAGAADVIESVRFAREHQLLTAVRGGGHSFPGLSVCDDGLVIDLGMMKDIRVDPERRTVRVQAGALLGELDRATQPFGLAVPAGIVTHTGVAGLTLGGGIGWIMRKYGLTIDQLLSVDVVTADGESVTASDDVNTDLFWGVRGGGGNFGIVTEFEFRLNPLGPYVMAGPVFWPIEQATRVLRFYRDWIAECPDEVMTIAVLRRAPDLPAVPPEWVGRHLIGIAACYAGPVDDGAAALAPLKAFGAPILDLCVPKPYVDHQATFDPSFRPGCWYYVRSCDVAGLNDDVIEITAEFGRRIGSSVSSLALWQLGGAVARVGDDETAFNGRGAGHSFNINGNAETAAGFEAEREWARAFWTALAPYHTSVYVNFLMEEGEARVEQAYGSAKYRRLKALKRTYDPGNLFRLNQNIRPD
ncbi:FAD-binding oxidoreductase [Phytoactinopolyspora halotolerans]|uniref:FAD-binding oxidoreductase n=1 Tax=Phytoactinopolyspora halotolerans TaxID=1981512 RepID=A0A6L9S332_9ACTN|nr:FAD-binding oxidoreductase [Phytoactinopolyspora halotolerans]NED99472.1 FAD-binding oxidoreductase [Phytoactinopolyspora halotolerans]